MFIDVQQRLLFYVVVGWEDDFTGYVIDYGSYPEQNRSYFTVREVERTLRRLHQGTGTEGAIYAGLEKLTGELLAREWTRDDGAVMRIGSLDAGRGEGRCAGGNTTAGTEETQTV